MRFLRVLGVAALLSLAGCSDGPALSDKKSTPEDIEKARQRQMDMTKNISTANPDLKSQGYGKKMGS